MENNGSAYTRMLMRADADNIDRTNVRARPRPSASVSGTNAQSCSPRNGVIHVSAAGTPGDNSRPALDGYLSRTGNEFGEYGYTTNRTDALTVTINDCNGAPFDIISSVC
jgi:hypothetical protein